MGFSESPALLPQANTVLINFYEITRIDPRLGFYNNATFFIKTYQVTASYCRPPLLSLLIFLENRGLSLIRSPLSGTDFLRHHFLLALGRSPKKAGANPSECF